MERRSLKKIRASMGLTDFFKASSFQLLKLENLLRWSFFTFTYNRSSNMNYFIYTSHQTWRMFKLSCNNPIIYPWYTHAHQRLNFLTSDTLHGSIWSIKLRNHNVLMPKKFVWNFKHSAVGIDSATFSSLMRVLQEVSKCFVQ